MDCVCSGERWNYSFHKENRSYDITEERLVLKTLADQRPEGMEIIPFYNELIPKFDLIILLSRKNKQEVYESFQHFVNTKENWHTEWNKEDDLEISEGVKNVVDGQYHNINLIRDQHNIPITWYEDLYSGNYEVFKETTKDWGVDTEEFFTYFNPKNRLRQ